MPSALPHDQKRHACIAFHVLEAEREALRARAAEREQSVSALIREALAPYLVPAERERTAA